MSRIDWMPGTAKDSCMTVLNLTSAGRPDAMTSWWCWSGLALVNTSLFLNVLPTPVSVMVRSNTSV
jgi:hypothetical protein